MSIVLDLQATPSYGRVTISGTAIIYIRVSTDRQREEGASLDVQRDACRRYCESHGLVVVAEFLDVQSGLDSHRPQYQAAVEYAKTKGIKKLVAWRFDRVGRDSAEYIPLLKALKRLGVDLVSVTQPTESIFMQEILGVMAEEESRQLSTRITASKQRRFKEGKWGNSPPFGYATQKVSPAEGGGSMLVTNEESPLVEEIFRRYATGKDSLGDLRKILNDAGYLKSSAAVSYILKSQVYLGLVPHGRYARSQFMPKPEITWVQGMHEALVDQELFDRVQSRLAGNVNRNRGGSHPRYLFSSLIHCANCGYKFAGRSQASNPSSEKLVQYRCSRRTSFGDCHSHSVQETRIRAAVIPPIESLLGKLRQEDIRVAVREELAGQRESVKAAQRQTTEGMTESQRRLEGRLSRLEDRYLDGDLSQERYLIRRDEFMAQLKEIQKDLATKPQPVLPDIDRVFSIAESITMEDLDDQAWREIIEAMVDRISIEGSATKTDGRRSPATIRVLWKAEYEPLLAMVV